MLNEFRHFRVDRDARDVVTVTIDVAERPVNVFDGDVVHELEMIVDTLAGDDACRGVVFRSGKASGFLAGADVNQIAELTDPHEAREISHRGQLLFERVERLPMPTVAVIHGPCLGGGLEFAMACGYRIAREDASTRLGLPEVQLGILPAWGGTQRLPRLVGLVPALSMMLQGTKLTAAKALRMGLVDRVASPETFDAAVEQLVTEIASERSEPGVEKSIRRDVKRSLTARLANGTRLGRWIVFQATQRQIARSARHYPATPAILDAVRAGFTKSRDAGFEAERNAFAELIGTPTCRNLLGLFFQRERARAASTWGTTTDDAPPIARVGVIGGGVMGAGIAQLAAWQGLPVVLREINEELLTAGMDRIRGLFDDAVRKGGLSESEGRSRKDLVTPTVDWAPLADVDLAIEAVVEREDVKGQVFAELERVMRPEAVLASNTSSLSIERLAHSQRRSARFAGLHFFNPVHRMELVEVVRGPETDEATIAALVRFVRKLGKTPIVAQDSPGFLVNRVLFPYLGEAVRMVVEGGDVAKIDREMKRFGMPMGPLELLDTVGLDVAAHVAKSMRTLGDAGPIAERLDAMAAAGRLGRKSGRGFYEWKGGRRGAVAASSFPHTSSFPRSAWERTARRSASSADDSERHEPRTHGVPWEPGATHPAGTVLAACGEALSLIQERLMLPIVNEAAKCLGEGIVAEAWMVDLAMALGTGFAPFRGGPLRLADELGVTRVVQRMDELRRAYGDRFAPCHTLEEMMRTGRRFFEKETVTEPAIPSSPRLTTT